MHKELDDFEVVNSGNNGLLETIVYIQNNVDSTTWNKLKKVNWLKDATNAFSLIPYILESNLSQTFTSLFRKSNDSNDLFTSIWVSKVSSIAKEKLINNDSRQNYTGISRESLYFIGKKASDPSSLSEIDNFLYQQYGIILLYIDNIPGMKTDAVTFLLETGHPVIGMSLRYSRYDYFWFTLMHELSHIHLHLENLNEPLVDEFCEDEDSEDVVSLVDHEIEIEANALAKEVLLPRQIWSKCGARQTLNKNTLLNFSNEYGIHSSIVAGQIRRERNNYKLFSELVSFLDIRTQLKKSL